MDNDSDSDDDDDDEYPLECWRSIKPNTAIRYMIDTDVDLIKVI